VRSSDWMTGKGPDCVQIQIHNTWGMGRHLAPWMAETKAFSRSSLRNFPSLSAQRRHQRSHGFLPERGSVGTASLSDIHACCLFLRRA
jgi:hypothetical protein